MGNQLTNDWEYFESLIYEESLAGDAITSKGKDMPPDSIVLIATVSRDDGFIRYIFNRETRKMSWYSLRKSLPSE